MRNVCTWLIECTRYSYGMQTSFTVIRQRTNKENWYKGKEVWPATMWPRA